MPYPWWQKLRFGCRWKGFCPQSLQQDCPLGQQVVQPTLRTRRRFRPAPQGYFPQGAWCSFRPKTNLQTTCCRFPRLVAQAFRQIAVFPQFDRCSQTQASLVGWQVGQQADRLVGQRVVVFRPLQATRPLSSSHTPCKCTRQALQLFPLAR